MLRSLATNRTLASTRSAATNRGAVVEYSGSLSFDGDNDTVDFGTLDITGFTEITVACKVKVKRIGTEMFLTIRHSGGDDIRLYTESGNITFGMDDGTASIISSDGGELDFFQQWITVIGTFVVGGTNNQKLYVQGVLADQDTDGFDITTADGEMHLGSRQGTSFFAGCLMSSARVLNKALTADEAMQYHLKGTTPYDNDPDTCIVKVDVTPETVTTTQVDDTSGNDNHGTITGAQLDTDAPSTKRMAVTDHDIITFDGVDDRVVVPHASWQLLTGGLSFFTFITPATLGEASDGFFLDKSTANDGSDGFQFRFDADRNLLLRVDGGATISTEANGIVLNRLQAIGFTLASDGSAKIYLNGLLAAEGTVAAPTAITTTNDLTIGNRSGATDRSYHGQMYGSKLYDSAISARDMFDLSRGLRPTTNLIADWSQVSGSTLIDAVNAYNGTITT